MRQSKVSSKRQKYVCLDGEVPREKKSRGEAFIDKREKCLQGDAIVLRLRKNLTFIRYTWRSLWNTQGINVNSRARDKFMYNHSQKKIFSDNEETTHFS